MRIRERAEGHGTHRGETLRAISSGMDEQVSCMHSWSACSSEEGAAAVRDRRDESHRFLLSQGSRQRGIYCVIPFI